MRRLQSCGLVRATARFSRHPSRTGPQPARHAAVSMAAAQALAAVRGRDYVVPDDAKDLAVPVALPHRIRGGAPKRA